MMSIAEATTEDCSMALLGFMGRMSSLLHRLDQAIGNGEPDDYRTVVLTREELAAVVIMVKGALE